MRVSAPLFQPTSQSSFWQLNDLQSRPVLLNEREDFDLPPALRLSPQQLEFIDLDQDAGDTFVRPRQQPETPRQQDNPFSLRAQHYKMPNTDVKPAQGKRTIFRKGRKNRANPMPQLEGYRREIAPLLAQHQIYKGSKTNRYPQRVKQLFRQAVRENPDVQTKSLADALGLPPAIAYYWRTYRNARQAKKAKKGAKA